jgi:hypothetical protein
MYNTKLVNILYFDFKKECNFTSFLRVKIEKEIEDPLEDLIYEGIGDVIQDQLIMKD